MTVFSNKKYENDIKDILNLFNKKNYIETEKKIKNLFIRYPDDCFIVNIYGVVLVAQKKNEQALIEFKKAINLNKSFSDGYFNIGTTLIKLFKYNEALYYFHKCIEINKNYYDAYFNLADCYKRIKDYENSIKYYDKCLEQRVNDCSVYNNLGLVYLKLKKFEISIKNFEKCLELNKDFFLAYNSLGLVYLEKNEYEKAIYFFNKCISINVYYVHGYNNIGIALFRDEKVLNSIFFFEKAISLDEKFYDAYINLAMAYKASSKYLEAINILNKLQNIEISQSDKAQALALLALYYIEIGELLKGYKTFEESLKLFEEFPELKDESILAFKAYIFSYNYNENFNFDKYSEIIERYKKLLKSNIKNFESIDFDKKLKVGFVSADFRKHPVGYQIYGVLKSLSLLETLEIHLYYNDIIKDDLNSQFKSIPCSWNNIKNLSDAELASKIKSDGIQVLVDLSGYTKGNRLEVFIEKAAPIQVSWLGYLASTGLKEMDYVLADSYAVTKAEENQFIEKIFRLDHAWSTLTCPEIVEVNNFIPAVKNKYITFGSFNNISKINIKVIDLWSKILTKNNSFKLYIKSSRFDDENVKKKYQNLFLEKGVLADQLIFESYSERKILFESYNKVDIALDTFPYSGGTTSLEAAWMCVPILTRAGNSFLSKCGESININLGLDDWICKDEDEYIQKAISFSLDIKKLQLTKDRLKANRNRCKLFDHKLFAENLSKSFIKMWDDYYI
jgi:predicted O-linked N-acetylglucosamine transferase (SPINDLY family)